MTDQTPSQAEGDREDEQHTAPTPTPTPSQAEGDRDDAEPEEDDTA
ncbi:hypothetical protein AB0N88_06335 [Streptomyces sp. NPDC093516]